MNVERKPITLENLRQHREAILEIARRYGAHDLRVFGSVARGDATGASDVDIIARFDPDRSLLDHGGLIMDLGELLGVKVDVISEAGMRPRFREHAMKEAIAL
ncbi:MAG: nucleotidyltransferase family protein [Planctomycetes bacterium]|nr:nucleotidyltransferase family protein [Planctomycetota bacterium]